MNSGQPPLHLERLRPTLQLKIKANSWNKGSAENSHELTWRRLFSFQLILVGTLFIFGYHFKLWTSHPHHNNVTDNFTKRCFGFRGSVGCASCEEYRQQHVHSDCNSIVGMTSTLNPIAIPLIVDTWSISNVLIWNRLLLLTSCDIMKKLLLQTLGDLKLQEIVDLN